MKVKRKRRMSRRRRERTYIAVMVLLTIAVSIGLTRSVMRDDKEFEKYEQQSQEFNARMQRIDEKREASGQNAILEQVRTWQQEQDTEPDKYAVFDTMSADWGGEEDGFVLYEIPEEYSRTGRNRKDGHGYTEQQHPQEWGNQREQTEKEMRRCSRMTVKDIMTLLESPDRVRVIKDGEEIYNQYFANMEVDKDIVAQIGDAEVKRFRAIPEITHRKYKERGLIAPMKPEETPDYSFRDLQLCIYHTITI